jgi:cell division septation protein DedD
VQHDTAEDGFHEIQLSGKQLVFLFMATTVVSVVIFLCGVLVGRGVRVTTMPADLATADVSPDLGPSASRTTPESTLPPPAVSTPASTPSASASATAPAEELSYAERLLRDTPPEENLKQAPATPAKPAPPAPAPAPAPAVQEPVATKAPAPRPPAPAPASAAAASTASDPSGPGFAVQVAISKDRREADTLAKELIGKGYPAFVMDPAKGAPAGIYRVRVGKYKNRKDAEEIAARLKTNEQFAPWIAR